MKNNLREEKEVVFDGCMNVLSLPSGWKAITPKKKQYHIGDNSAFHSTQGFLSHYIKI